MISKTALNKNNFKRPTFMLNSAREGWELVLKTLDPTDKILLPSYIGVTDREGSGIYDPVTTVGLNHQFYLLNNDLTISIDKIENLLVTNEYKLLLVVHYFGFISQNIEDIAILCKQYEVILVEDCAHLYNFNSYAYSNAGTFGDYAFYSLHKYLPIATGGILVQNRFGNSIENNLKGDSISQITLELIKYDIGAITDKRLENFKLLDRLISDIPGLQSIRKINKGDVPHNYPVIVKDGLREKLYFWLIDKNITLIALYYRLIEPLKDKKFDEMQYISNNILNLPVHQDLSFKDLHLLITNIKLFYEKYR